MKTILFCLATMLTIISCSNDDIDDFDCTGDCLDKSADAIGIISFTNCYDKWSITFEVDSVQAIIIDPDPKLEEEGLRVEVDALFYENDYPFLMPDPPGPISKKIEILDFKILD